MVRHHVVYLAHMKAENVPIEKWFDLRCALDLGMWCPCHSRQHSGAHRLHVSILPAAAVEFAVEVLGEARGMAYLDRYYDDR